MSWGSLACIFGVLGPIFIRITFFDEKWLQNHLKLGSRGQLPAQLSTSRSTFKASRSTFKASRSTFNFPLNFQGARPVVAAGVVDPAAPLMEEGL